MYDLQHSVCSIDSLGVGPSNYLHTGWIYSYFIVNCNRHDYFASVEWAPFTLNKRIGIRPDRVLI